MPRKKETIIRATVLYDGKVQAESRTVVVEGNRIASVTGKGVKADYEGVVTPAFIDAHCHIGMDRDGEPWQESEVNDYTHQIRPLNDPLNSVYFDDRAFTDAVDFGVLYSCVVPGSGNLVGGRAMVIRNYAKNRSEALIKDYG